LEKKALHLLWGENSNIAYVIVSPLLLQKVSFIFKIIKFYFLTDKKNPNHVD